MCKKVTIAALAVAVGLLVVSFTKVGSHLRVWKRDLVHRLEKQIPPEQEIARLKLDLDNLAKEDDRYFDLVATQRVDTRKLDAQLETMKKDLKTREARIVAMQASLENKDKLVTYEGEQIERTKLLEEARRRAASFQIAEQTFKSKEEQLALKKQILNDNEAKLARMKLEREELRTELVRLETSLMQERQAQAAEHKTIDAPGYIRLSDDLSKVKTTIETMKEKRVLKAEGANPIRAIEQKKEQEAAIDNYLKARFGNKQ